MLLVPFLLASSLSGPGLASFSLDALANDPEARIEDSYKWLLQAARGGEHAVGDEKSARRWLDREWASLGPALPGEPLLVPLRPDGAVVRLNLRPFRDRGGSKETVLRAFVTSARSFDPDGELFRSSWAALGERLEARPSGSLTSAEWKRLDEELREEGYPAIEHSAPFETARHPAYRVLTGDEAIRLVRTLDAEVPEHGRRPIDSRR